MLARGAGLVTRTHSGKAAFSIASAWALGHPAVPEGNFVAQRLQGSERALRPFCRHDHAAVCYTF